MRDSASSGRPALLTCAVICVAATALGAAWSGSGAAAPSTGSAAAAPSGGAASRAGTAARAPAATVWAVGDAYPNAGGRRVAALVRRARPDLLLYLGDVYETGTARDFTRRFDPLYGSLAGRTLPAIGNHEYANRATGYGPYWAAKTGRAMPQWMSRWLSGWQILMLSSEAPHAARSPQLRWLARATRRPGTCRIAITHRPRFSTGGHGDQRDMAPLWQALRGRARLLLSGHDHDLQRLADRDGLRQLVAGAGGRANLPIGQPSVLRLRFAERLRPGALRMRLSPGRARLDLVDADGRLLDRSRVTCRRLRG